MNKTRLKFIGSAALIITTLGILLAILGQLDFIGSERSETVAVKNQKKSDDKPKYSFYDELKKRKVEVDDKKGTVTNRSITVSKDKDEYDQYVVQAGALSQVQVGPLSGKRLAISTEKSLKSKNYPTLIKRLK